MSVNFSRFYASELLAITICFQYYCLVGILKRCLDFGEYDEYLAYPPAAVPAMILLFIIFFRFYSVSRIERMSKSDIVYNSSWNLTRAYGNIILMIVLVILVAKK